MKSLTPDQLAAVVYADLFGYPLTVKEAKLWAIRKTRGENSAEKLAKAKEITIFLKQIPTVQAIFVTGSVGVNNAKAKADIDLMIVTLPDTLWLTRLIVFLAFKLTGKLKKPYCPNIFLDTNHLEIPDKNLYVAHEVLQAQCLYDRGDVARKWLEANAWTREYLPRAYKHKMNYVLCIKGYAGKDGIIHNTYPIPHSLLLPFELVAFLLQYLYMKNKMTSEQVGWGFALFHPNSLSKKVLRKFTRRLVKYTR